MKTQITSQHSFKVGDKVNIPTTITNTGADSALGNRKVSFPYAMSTRYRQCQEAVTTNTKGYSIITHIDEDKYLHQQGIKVQINPDLDLKVDFSLEDLKPYMLSEFTINAHHRICEDHFEDGEGDSTGAYANVVNYQASDWQSAVQMYFEGLGYKFDIKHCSVDEEGISVHYSVLVDDVLEEVQANTPTYDEWKAGHIILYSDTSHITVTQNVPVTLTLEP